MQFLTLPMIVLLLLPACSQNQFAGAPDAAGEAATSSEPKDGDAKAEQPAPIVTSSNPLLECVKGDQIVVPWSGPVKECMDQGKTWQFDTKTCTEIRSAPFTCDWATLQGKLQDLDLLSATLQKDAAEGAKLISCGQAADGNRIAVQWVKLNEVSGVSCNSILQGAGVTTGCYTHYVGQQPPPPANSEEEKRQRVQSCLQNL